jgi:hypothetical protein
LTYYPTPDVLPESLSLKKNFSEVKAVIRIIQGDPDPYPLTVKFDVSSSIGALPMSCPLQNPSVRISRISKNDMDYAPEGAKLLD